MPINATQSCIDLNLLKYSMQQVRHSFFTWNSDLIKHLRKKCLPLGLLFQQGIDYKKYGRNKKCPLASIYDTQEKSATSRLFLILTKEKIAFVCSHVQLHFPRFLQNEPFCSEGFFPSEEDDVLKQIQQLTSTQEIPTALSPDSQPLTTETAIFVKSHLKSDGSHFQEAPQSLVKPRDHVLLDYESYQACAGGRRCSPGASILQLSCQNFKTCPNSKWPPLRF